MASRLYEIAFQIAGKVNSNFNSSFQTAKDKVRNLNTEVSRLKNMDEAYNKGSKAVHKFAMSHDEVKRKLQEIIPLQQKMQRQAQLEQNIKANKQSITGKAGELAGAVAVAAPLAAPVVAFAKAEESATKLKATMMDATGAVSANFEAVNKLATDLGNKLPGATSDFHDLFNVMLQNGVKAEQILGGVGKAAAYIGVQLKIPYAEAGKYAAQMQKSTGVADADMLQFMDTIQRMSNFGIQIEDMNQAFSKLGATTSMLKLQGIENMKTFGPMLSMIMQYGLRGESAGNALGKVLRAGLDLDKVKKANKELSVLGIKLDFIDKKGNFAGVENMMAQLAKLKNLSGVRRTQVIEDLFGNDAETLQVVSNLIENGSAGLQTMQARMEAQASLTQRVELQLKTLSAGWESFTGTLTNVMVLLGGPLAGIITPLLGRLNDFVGGPLMTFIQNNGQLVAGIMASAAGLATLNIAVKALSLGWLILKGGVLQVISIFNTVWNVVGKVFTIFRLLATFFMANPILLAITAIAVAAFLIYKNWDTVKAWLIQAWAVVSSKFMEYWTIIQNFGLGVWESLKNAASIAVEFWKNIFNGVVSWFSNLSLYDSGMKIIETLVSGIKAMASYPIDAIKSIFGKMAEYLPHSDADKGPLSTLSASGAAIVETMAQGARQAATGTNIGAVAADGFSPIGKITPIGSSPSTGGSTITYAPTIYVSGPDAAQNKAAVESGLKSGFEDFSRKMKDFMTQERRVSYA